MMTLRKPSQGLFITGTDTGVGKTYVAALIARALVDARKRVGVYKPAASGCRQTKQGLICDDAQILWQAAGQPGDLCQVCPQCFVAPLAPHLAAQAEGKSIDGELLRRGLEVWTDQCDIVVVEGAGGLMSPLSRNDYVADLAHEFRYPLVIVAPNVLGVINQTLQTLMTAAGFRSGLEIAGVVLNDIQPSPTSDPSVFSNRQELLDRCDAPLLAHVPYGATEWSGKLPVSQTAE